MYLRKRLMNGVTVAIIVPAKAEERLRSTCFRGPEHRLAGNFFTWMQPRDIFERGVIPHKFLQSLTEDWKLRRFGDASITLAADTCVGWESTDARTNYADDDLEKFSLNRRSTALRVKLERTDLRAPLTRLVTFVYDFAEEDGRARAIIRSMYPGKDVGPLRGDVTREEGRVFFDWNHPGGVHHAQY